MAEGSSSQGLPGSLANSSQLPPPRTRIFKIIVIGDSGVGKTCLTYRFCAGRFPGKTEATIGVDFRERLVDIDGEKIKVGTPQWCGWCAGLSSKTNSLLFLIDHNGLEQPECRFFFFKGNDQFATFDSDILPFYHMILRFIAQLLCIFIIRVGVIHLF